MWRYCGRTKEVVRAVWRYCKFERGGTEGSVEVGLLRTSGSYVSDEVLRAAGRYCGQLGGTIGF